MKKKKIKYMVGAILDEREIIIKGLDTIQSYPVGVEGYNSPGAIMLRMVHIQALARSLIKTLEG